MRVRKAAGGIRVLVAQSLAPGVGDVEGVEPDPESQAFRELPGIFDVSVYGAGDRCATKIAATEQRHFAWGSIRLLGDQRRQRHTGLNFYASAEDHALDLAVIENVGDVGVADVAAVGNQLTDTLLLADKTEHAFGQVEQRANARVSLVVVVAEGAFVVAAEASDAIVGNQGPVVTEALVDFKFHGLVFTLGIFVGVRLAIGLEFTAKQSVWIGIQRSIQGREAGTSYDMTKRVSDVRSDEFGWSVAAVHAGSRKAQSFECRSV